MTPKQRRSLAKYIGTIAVELGLRDWELIFPPVPSSDGTLAEVEPTYGQRRALITFASHFDHEPPEVQRRVVLHELLHVHFAQQNQAASDGFKPMGVMGEIAHDAYRLGHEYGIDAIATAIANFYPLWEGK